jgi:hypothetical protein
VAAVWSFVHLPGDPGGVRTRDLLDENQVSWTTRRRDHQVDAQNNRGDCTRYWGEGQSLATQVNDLLFHLFDYCDKLFRGDLCFDQIAISLFLELVTH